MPSGLQATSQPSKNADTRSGVEAVVEMAIVAFNGSLSSSASAVVSVMESRVENRRSGFSLPVAVGVLSRDPPQSGLA
jgi:hypothetical protein